MQAITLEPRSFQQLLGEFAADRVGNVDSPSFNAASRVESSGITFITSRSTLGFLRQYPSKASSTSSTPGVNDTNLYGPAPIGAFLNPSSPTFSTYFFGTIQPAPLALP